MELQQEQQQLMLGLVGSSRWEAQGTLIMELWDGLSWRDFKAHPGMKQPQLLWEFCDGLKGSASDKPG